MHTVFRYWFSPYLVCYRYRAPAGNWTLTETPGRFPFQDTPWIVEDAQLRPHIFYAGGPDGNWPTHWTQIYEVYKQNGIWTLLQVTPTENKHHGYPRASLDPAGNIHLVYLKTDLNSTTTSTLYHRMFNGTSWSSDTAIGTASNFYYHHSDVACTSDGRLHVVWVAAGGSRLQFMYRRMTNGVWGSPIVLGGSVTQNWLSFPRLSALDASTLVAAVNDDNNGGAAAIKIAVSHDGGNSWSAYTQLTPGNYVSMTNDPSGLIRMVYSWPGEQTLGYTSFDGQSWSSPLQISQPLALQASPDVAIDTAGLVHVVTDSQTTGSPRNIRYFNSSAPPGQPGPPLPFTATPYHNQVGLIWQNPPGNFVGTIIRCGTQGYPVSPADGALVCDRLASPDSTDSFLHLAVNGITYYYSAFAYDSAMTYSTAAHASATPFIPHDFDRDNDVDQSDFGFLQACLSIASFPSPACIDADLNNDGLVNGPDVALWLNCQSGADTLYVPTCAD